MFKKHPRLPKESIKKMDAVVTGLILWWVVASIYGIKKDTEGKEERAPEKGMISKKDIIHMLMFGCEDRESEKKKEGFVKRTIQRLLGKK